MAGQSSSAAGSSKLGLTRKWEETRQFLAYPSTLRPTFRVAEQ